MLKLYIAGPMTGRENKNRLEFERVCQQLRVAGHDARVPHEFGTGGSRQPDIYLHGELGSPADTVPEPSWLDWMWWCMRYLAAWQPDGVVFLQDWPTSPGATAEAAWFQALAQGAGAGAGAPRVFVNAHDTYYEVDPRQPVNGRTWVYRAEVGGLVEMPQPHLPGPDTTFGLVKGEARTRWPAPDGGAAFEVVHEGDMLVQVQDAPADIPPP